MEYKMLIFPNEPSKIGKFHGFKTIKIERIIADFEGFSAIPGIIELIGLIPMRNKPDKKEKMGIIDLSNYPGTVSGAMVIDSEPIPIKPTYTSIEISFEFEGNPSFSKGLNVYFKMQSV